MRRILPRRRSLRLIALGATVLAFVLVATGLYAVLAPQQAAASSIALTVLDGVVTVTDRAGLSVEAEDGQLIGAGDTVTTGPDGHAILTYFDGSTVSLEPDTSLEIQLLEATPAGDLVVSMFQAFGSTWHVIGRKLQQGSKYQLRTPTATATARGTAFTVVTDENGDTTQDTTDGVVLTEANGSTVEVPAGFLTSTTTGAAPTAAELTPEPPATVTFVLGAESDNAAVVDANGRAVGVANGQPIRTIPGSIVTLNDQGQLVMRVPQLGSARLSTVVHVPKGSAGVPIASQVDVLGVGTVASALEVRTPDADGTARGGIALTPDGVVVLSEDDANSFVAPKLGDAPAAPAGGIPLLGGAQSGRFIPRLTGPGAARPGGQAGPRSPLPAPAGASGRQGGPSGFRAPVVDFAPLAGRKASDFGKGGFVPFQAPAAGATPGAAPPGAGFAPFTQAPPTGSFGAAPPSCRVNCRPGALGTRPAPQAGRSPQAQGGQGRPTARPGAPASLAPSAGPSPSPRVPGRTPTARGSVNPSQFLPSSAAPQRPGASPGGPASPGSVVGGAFNGPPTSRNPRPPGSGSCVPRPQPGTVQPGPRPSGPPCPPTSPGPAGQAGQVGQRPSAGPTAQPRSPSVSSRPTASVVPSASTRPTTAPRPTAPRAPTTAPLRRPLAATYRSGAAATAQRGAAAACLAGFANTGATTWTKGSSTQLFLRPSRAVPATGELLFPPGDFGVQAAQTVPQGAIGLVSFAPRVPLGAASGRYDLYVLPVIGGAVVGGEGMGCRITVE